MRGLLLATACLAGACNSPCRASADHEPELTIGTGEFDYEPMPETLDFVYGMQGGYHLLIGLEARYLNGKELMVATMTGTLQGVEAARVQPWLEMECSDGALHSAGSFLIYDAIPDELADQPTTIQVSLQDIDGNVATAETSVIITDPGPPPELAR